MTVSPELRAQRERIAAARRCNLDELPALIQAVEETLNALSEQPFAVQVACRHEALQAALDQWLLSSSKAAGRSGVVS